MVLPFKDSEGGTCSYSDFNWSYLCRHASAKKQTQYANRAKAIAPYQNVGPAISEAAEPSRCHAERDLPTPYISLVCGAVSLETVKQNHFTDYNDEPSEFCRPPDVSF